MKDFIIRNIKKVRRLWIASTYINWPRLFGSLFSSKSDAYVLYPNFWNGLITNEIEHVLLLYGVVQTRFKNVKFRHGKNANTLKNTVVFYNPSEKFNYKNKINYTQELVDLVVLLENNGNKVFYPSKELLYWENKTYLYNQFEKLGIRHPKTRIFKTVDIKQFLGNVDFPCLVKEEHSFASLGVHKIDSANAFFNLVDSFKFKVKNENIVIQELLNIHRDLRVIIIGDEIVLHYWRINPDKDWKPTSTSHGTDVDFITFPEQWRDYLILAHKKLNLSASAFDVAWENDNLESEPYLLEVSPYFQPNPPVDIKYLGISYGQYKKKLIFTNSWDSNYLKIVFQFKCKMIDEWMKESLGL